jgi:sulfite reductase (NADPH) flavoprotein alpha-component
MIAVIPENAPFSASQRAWLNGFFAGLIAFDESTAQPLSTDAPLLPPAAPAEEEDFPWHDPALTLEQRMKLAEGKPLKLRLMATMGQLDCGQCGYLCRSYAEVIADGSEKELGKCVPGGKATAKMLKLLVAENPSEAEPPVSTRSASPAQLTKARPEPTRDKPAPSRDNPASARLLRSEPLNRPGAEKQTQNVVLSLFGTGLDYAPGDSIGVWPVNYGEEVELVLAILRARGSEPVSLPDGSVLTAREALLKRCNLREAGDELFRLLSRHAKDDIEATRLARLAEDDGAEAGIHDVFDVLVKFRSARPPISEFVLALGALQPRLYSIASSLRCHPGEVHLTVAVVRYDLHRRGYKGVASNYFAERLRPGQRVPVYIQHAHGFSLPADPAAPVIMVGPGTGIAPFRAFLQERSAAGAPGRNWLFFGSQRRELDFLYRGELEGYVKKGILTRLDTAFSRDQQHKIYVQNRMLENAAELWRWLKRGAYFYVCGDAQRMAMDVDRALIQIVAEQGGMDAAGANDYVFGMTRAKRYLRDVY